ncbi:MAG TPA: glycosyltransferase family 39 protein [Isosphaeraceae bacterium]|nr:glycosyltransferase family 39 protein [Isosphaeraceae bacterium]
MIDPTAQPDSGRRPDAVAVRPRWQQLALPSILLVATLLRLLHLDRHSLWYDEVVSMRLARTDGPRALLASLFQIDATRAPLHPLLLQAWLRLFGTSELAGRSFSAACGVLTVLVVYLLGREAFDARTGRWAAWLAATSPALVRYSQEVRMYAWFVLVTALSWWFLLRLRRSSSRWCLEAFAASQVAMAYSHPLALLMLATQVGVILAFRRSFRVSWRGWFVAEMAVGLVIAPWVGHYLDHPPESTSGRLPLRFLLGLPIEFVGGDSTALLLCVALIAFGLYAGGRSFASIDAILLTWFAVPTLVLYLASRVGPPVFGPARYNLYVAPAYLLLLARGLVSLRWWYARLVLALAGLILALPMIESTVYAPDLKADWRAARRYLDGFDFEDTPVTVVVVSADPRHNVEVETAREYLAGSGARVVSAEEASANPGGLRTDRETIVIFAVGVRGREAVVVLPHRLADFYDPRIEKNFHGLRFLMTSVP